MNRWLGIALVLVALGALGLRLPQLALRPMHNDEAVNASKLQALWEQGPKGYRYDPDEYHGPILPFASLPSLWLSGAKDFAQVTEANLRIVPVVFGVGLILLLWLMGDGLGRAGALFAGLITAISPAMVFYSRYYIHETLLIFFTFLLFAAGWRYSRTRQVGWALLGGAALGLMYTTKETFPISLVALGGATLLTVLWDRAWRRFQPGLGGWVEMARRLNWKHILAALGMTALIAVLLFTSFFTNANGLLDSVRTYLHWGRRAGGASPHIWPWYYYQERLLWFRDGQGLGGLLYGLWTTHKLHLGRGPIWSEATIVLLSAIGFFSALRRHPIGARGKSEIRISKSEIRISKSETNSKSEGEMFETNRPEPSGGARICNPPAPTPTSFFPSIPDRGTLCGANINLVRFVGFYSALMVLAYSAISYKTPWCLLGFWHGTILLAGVGAAVVLSWRTRRWLQGLLSAVLVLAAGHLVWQSALSSHALPDSPRYASPYEYSPTSPDLFELVHRVQALAKIHAQGDAMLIKVLTPDSDCWPLPWYLRQFSQVDYLDKFPAAPVMVVSSRLEGRIEQATETTHTLVGYFSLRHRVTLGLYVENGLWKQYLAAQKKGETL